MMIEPMNSSHMSQVAELEKLCFPDPWSEKSIASELNNPLSLWLVVTDGARVAAYVGSQSVMDESDMMNIAVHPDYRRGGLARSLVEALVSELQKKGVRMLTLEVRASNAPAIALYDTLGFAQVGRRKNYYLAPKEDALILRKEWSL